MAAHRSQRDIIIVLLVGIGALPCIPWHVFVLGSALIMSYVVSFAIAESTGVITQPFQDPSLIVNLMIVTILCTALAAVNYHRILSGYKSHQLALSAAEEARRTELRACNTENAASMAKLGLVRRGDPMKRTWTIIGVGDVPGSFKWYQALFGQPATLPAHDYFGQILDSDGTVLLCLHEWGAHEHPSLMSPDHGTPGNGLLLFFRVDDFDLALQRARSLVTRLEEEPHVNPNTQTKEFSLRDPDGYYVTISALSAA